MLQKHHDVGTELTHREGAKLSIKLSHTSTEHMQLLFWCAMTDSLHTQLVRMDYLNDS